MGNNDQSPSDADGSRSLEENHDFEGTICSICQSIFIKLQRLSPHISYRLQCGGVHHPTASSFEESAKQNCRICLEIQEYLKPVSWAEILFLCANAAGFTAYKISIVDPDPSYFSGLLDFDRPLVHETNVVRCVFRLGLAPNGLRQDHGLKDNTGSLRSLNCISKWMEGVESPEDSDESKSTGRFSPTRLLKIGKHADTPIRLCESGTRDRYATLSYCWGSGQPVKLTMENKKG